MLSVADFDALDTAEASAELRPVTGSENWISRVSAARPYGTLEVLSASAEQVLAGLSWDDVLEALDAHPRIGQQVTGTQREDEWSRDEQSNAASVDDAVRQDLVDGNVRYEEKFGHVFLICATGLEAEQVLAALTSRLHNSKAAEQDVVREELRKIVALRLAKTFAPDDETIAL